VGLVRATPTTTAVQGLGLFALGIVVGGAVALLVTPVTGREFRERVQERVQEVMNDPERDEGEAAEQR
jgi:gas vesicle protein